jgi:DNA-binding CsgD family transcriptional regulator
VIWKGHSEAIMPPKRTPGPDRPDENDSGAGLMEGAALWRPMSPTKVLVPVQKSPAIGGHYILILSNAQPMQQAIAAVLTDTFGGADIKAMTSLADVQARLTHALRDVAIDPTLAHDPAHGQAHGQAAATLLKQTDLGLQVIALGPDDAADAVTAWSEIWVGARPGDPLSLGDTAVNETAGPRPRIVSSSANSVGAILTAREEEVARLIMSGESNKEIARSLDISVATVKSHVHNLLAKLGLQRRGKLRQWYEQQLSLQPIRLPSPPDVAGEPPDGHDDTQPAALAPGLPTMRP